MLMDYGCGLVGANSPSTIKERKSEVIRWVFLQYKLFRRNYTGWLLQPVNTVFI